MSILFREEIGIKRKETGGKSVNVVNLAVNKCFNWKINPAVFTVEKSVLYPKKIFFLKYINMVEKFLDPVSREVSFMIFDVHVVIHVIDGLIGYLSIFYLLSVCHILLIELLIKK